MGGDSGVECRGDCAVEHTEGAGNGLGQESIVEEAPRRLRMEFCSALRRRETEHAVRREGFGLESGVSGGRRGKGGATRWNSGAGRSLEATIGAPRRGPAQAPFHAAALV